MKAIHLLVPALLLIFACASPEKKHPEAHASSKSEVATDTILSDTVAKSDSITAPKPEPLCNCSVGFYVSNHFKTILLHDEPGGPVVDSLSQVSQEDWDAQVGCTKGANDWFYIGSASAWVKSWAEGNSADSAEIALSERLAGHWVSSDQVHAHYDDGFAADCNFDGPKEDRFMPVGALFESPDTNAAIVVKYTPCDLAHSEKRLLHFHGCCDFWLDVTLSLKEGPQRGWMPHYWLCTMTETTCAGVYPDVKVRKQ